MKFEVIESLLGQHPLGLMCRVYGVSSGGFYEWRRRQANPSAKAQRRLKLLRSVEAAHLGSAGKYGAERVQGVTSGMGFSESPRTIGRVMQTLRLRSKLKKKFKVTTDSAHKLPIAPNLLMQDFRAYGPNQIWMSDLTYIATSQGWLYVCAIIDLYSRKIVGWAASSRMTVDLVQAAYLRACQIRRPGRGLIFHSDRGSQFAARAFRRMLKRKRHLQSMSRKGNCWDSAPIESFWHTLKTEHVYWHRYITREDALLSIRLWIEEDYNRVRSHTSIGKMSPEAFERKGVAVAKEKF